MSSTRAIVKIKVLSVKGEGGCYLVPILALPRPKDPVVEGVQGVVEVGLLKAVVVQDLQGVQNPSYREAWSHRGGGALNYISTQIDPQVPLLNAVLLLFRQLSTWWLHWTIMENEQIQSYIDHLFSNITGVGLNTDNTWP